MSATPPALDTRTEAPHWTVGDRLAAFAALLPAQPAGAVVLMVSDRGRAQRGARRRLV
jgi:hypothetical protein